MAGAEDRAVSWGYCFELDRCHSVNKQSPCPLTKQIQLFFRRPNTPMTFDLLEASFKVQPNVVVDEVRLDVVKDKNIRRLRQKRETEASLDPWIRATGKEEFNLGDLGYKPPEEGKDC